MSGIIGLSRDIKSGVIGGYPTGHVIQTITSTSETETNASETSYTTITDMNAAITPKYASSKILMWFNCGSMISYVQNSVMLKITGTTTGIISEQSRYGYDNGGTDWTALPIAVASFDTPGTVATQTYQLFAKVQTQGSGGADTWRINGEESGVGTKQGNIILQEIQV